LTQSGGSEIWDTFDSAVERAQSALQAAREDFGAVEDMGGTPRAVYGTARDELSEDIERFDSVYQVGEEECDAAVDAAERAELLADIGEAFRRYHEALLEQEVSLLKRWFDGLEQAITESGDTIGRDAAGLEKRITAASKLVAAGKHPQLRTSEKVYLSDIEAEVRELDEDARNDLPPELYVDHMSSVAEEFQSQYTDTLANLVSEGVERSAISVRAQVDEAPDINDIEDRLEAGGDFEQEDAKRVTETVVAYYEIAMDTTKRRAEFELSTALVEAVSSNELVDDDTEAELRGLTNTLDVGELRNRAAGLVGGVATTSEQEQVLRLLREHDGSIRRTMRTVDQEPEEFFATLHTLLREEEIKDLEANFE
jgi:hypothetical protein